MMDNHQNPQGHVSKDAGPIDTLQKFMVENAPVRGEFV